MLDMFAAAHELTWREVPRLAIEDAYEKLAYSPTLTRLGELLGFLPGKYPGGIPNHPSPLVGMLSGGLLGAGLGYGAGVLGEKLMPETWEKGRLRRTLALAGGALGAAPGALLTGLSAYKGHNVLGPWPFGPAHVPNQGPKTSPSWPRMDEPKFGLPEISQPKLAESRYVEAAESLGPLLEKIGRESYTGLDQEYNVNINPYVLNQVLWDDPQVSPYISLPVRAATSGLVAGAGQLSPGGPGGWITPHDVGRMAAGMGVGYVSGALVGKALGLLTGMPDSTQRRLRHTGMYAGLINTIVPRLFGALQ